MATVMRLYSDILASTLFHTALKHPEQSSATGS